MALVLTAAATAFSPLSLATPALAAAPSSGFEAAEVEVCLAVMFACRRMYRGQYGPTPMARRETVELVGNGMAAESASPFATVACALSAASTSSRNAASCAASALP